MASSYRFRFVHLDLRKQRNYFLGCPLGRPSAMWISFLYGRQKARFLQHETASQSTGCSDCHGISTSRACITIAGGMPTAVCKQTFDKFCHCGTVQRNASASYRHLLVERALRFAGLSYLVDCAIVGNLRPSSVRCKLTP